MKVWKIVANRPVDSKNLSGQWQLVSMMHFMSPQWVRVYAKGHRTIPAKERTKLFAYPTLKAARAVFVGMSIDLYELWEATATGVECAYNFPRNGHPCYPPMPAADTAILCSSVTLRKRIDGATA